MERDEFIFTKLIQKQEKSITISPSNSFISPNNMKKEIHVLVVMALLVTSTTVAAETVVGRSNATKMSEWSAEAAAEEEFLMASETSRRILATIGRGTLNPKRPFCNARIYNSCIRSPNKKYDKRPCTYANSCNRKP